LSHFCCAHVDDDSLQILPNNQAVWPKVHPAVPPLCVVGISLAEGEWSAASGALLLFVTNFLAILLAGGGMLALLGLSAATTKGLRSNARRRAFVLVAIGVMLVASPLSATTWRVYRQNVVERDMTQLAQEWLAETNYSIDRITVSEDQVFLIIYGSGRRPVLSELGSQLDASFDQPVDLSLIVVPSELEDYVTQKE
jgi:hypothetical protein